MLGDKAYSSKANRELLRTRGIQAVIPERSDQVANRKRRGRYGGRTIGLDTEPYKRRNVVERSFNTFKQWRGLATRYDKLALTYRGGVVLRAITIWLHELGDTPWGHNRDEGTPRPQSRFLEAVVLLRLLR